MRKIKTFFRLITTPGKLIMAFGHYNFFNWIPDKLYLKMVYKGETGIRLNLKNPRTFSEKLQWLKLYDRKPIYIKYVDKYSVRQIISDTIGERYLIPLIGVYDNADDIPFHALPEQFVLKCTHGSSSNIICPDRSKLDVIDAKKSLKGWMKKNWFWFGREWPYKHVKPRIICETFIGEKDTPPHDFKVMCFNGEPRLIEIHIGRFDHHVLDTYDTNWNKKNYKWEYNQTHELYEKPSCLDEMLHMSRKLAHDTYHCRIDWFVVRSKLYFGEITLYPASGFRRTFNVKGNQLLGSWIKLPTDVKEV